MDSLPITVSSKNDYLFYKKKVIIDWLVVGRRQACSSRWISWTWTNVTTHTVPSSAARTTVTSSPPRSRFWLLLSSLGHSPRQANLKQPKTDPAPTLVNPVARPPLVIF